MPRRNDKITSTQAYWIRQENGKGYSVFSREQLDKLINEGKILPTDKVQIRSAWSN